MTAVGVAAPTDDEIEFEEEYPAPESDDPADIGEPDLDEDADIDVSDVSDTDDDQAVEG
ncbi:hypothetical protein [Microlunatus ginsengisoli]|jgi:hypothetical protein|uniref:DNA primase n=1 Tax=Microlunatus ginsengisoli TaxID=363863 RepID=A0ABP6ZJQ2_9ACTN